MNVSPIQYNHNISLRGTTAGNSTQPKQENFSPAKIGAIAGVGCFGAGFLFDRACAYLFKLTRDIKTSLVVNGVVGLGIGTYAYIQAKNAEKEYSAIA